MNLPLSATFHQSISQALQGSSLSRQLSTPDLRHEEAPLEKNSKLTLAWNEWQPKGENFMTGINLHASSAYCTVLLDAGLICFRIKN